MKIHHLNFEESYGSSEIIEEREKISNPNFIGSSDNSFFENRNFEYLIFEPDNAQKEENGKLNSFIFLFHGLNERSWDKYISWAETLSKRTGRAVVLFPLAFHINRSPLEWSNPREMNKLMNNGTGENKKFWSLSFANYALSERIKADPYRFYLAGKQTIYNICQLIEQIDKGEHQLIKEGSRFDIFAYSIGALLSQVMVQSNPGDRFSNAKLFMFCGGSLFNKMNGESKLIMDRESFKLLKRYYSTRFVNRFRKKEKIDSIDEAFLAHIGLKKLERERFSFYQRSKERIKIISLKNDKVIPTKGIKMAVGPDCEDCIEEIDFTYKYSHEVPFPVNIKEKDSREYWFNEVFKRASDFLL